MFERVEFRWNELSDAAATTRALLSGQSPGAALGALLTSVKPSELDMHDLVSHISACERQIASLQAKQLTAIRELSGRRLAPGRNGEPADSPFPDGKINEFAADEVAAALSLARSTGQQRVWLANAIRRHPRTEAALAAGRLTLSKARAIVEELTVLDDEAAALAEERVLNRAPEQTLGNVRRSLARAIAAADPRAATRRAIRARTERKVILTPQPNGMCEFWALLPAADAMALWSVVTAMADKARAAERAAETDAETDATANPETDAAADEVDAEEPTDAADSDDATDEPDTSWRTMDQLRADVLADLAYEWLARDDLPRWHRRRPHIQVTVALSTLLGLDDQPAELDGYGPITADVARRIAAEGTWRRLLTDPATGGLLDYGRTTHDPPADLTDHVISRDQTCRGLGCRIAAERCDIDHTIRFPDGPTADHNLNCLCRRCHIRKHEAGWTLDLDPNGDICWTSPTGHTYADPVPPVLDSIPRPRTPVHDMPPF